MGRRSTKQEPRDFMYQRGDVWWADLSTRGGKRISLETTDEATGVQLTAHKIDRLQRQQIVREETGITDDRPSADLGSYTRYYHKLVRDSGASERYLTQLRIYLDEAVAFFEREGPRDLRTIRLVHAQAFCTEQQNTIATGRKDENGEPRKRSAGSVIHRLNAVSALFKQAQAEEYCELNPFTKVKRPKMQGSPTEWFEVDEAATLLAEAKKMRDEALARPYIRQVDVALPMIHALLGTLLLTGGRAAEVFGLRVEDVWFDSHIIRFVVNKARRLKNRHRPVPLWPQLEEILREYVATLPEGTEYLFPVPAGCVLRSKKRAKKSDSSKPFLQQCYGTFDMLATRTKVPQSKVRPLMMRHTYCAARLQTTDGGKPVSAETVIAEMGHNSGDMVKEIYGHVGRRRHRSEVVEYLPAADH